MHSDPALRSSPAARVNVCVCEKEGRRDSEREKERETVSVWRSKAKL